MSATVMFKADLRPLCAVYMIINVSYTDIVGHCWWGNTTDNTQRVASLTYALRYNVNHHLHLLDFYPCIYRPIF